jgi:uncharacterized membrane protein
MKYYAWLKWVWITYTREKMWGKLQRKCQQEKSLATYSCDFRHSWINRFLCNEIKDGKITGTLICNQKLESESLNNKIWASGWKRWEI